MRRPGRRWCRSTRRTIERIDGHGIAQHVDVAVLLRKPLGQRLPLVAARAAPIDAQLALGRVMLRVALDRHDIDGLGLVSVHVDREPEIARQIAAHLVPRVTRIVAAHHVPVLLHEQHVRARRVHRDMVHAVPDLRGGVGDVRGAESLVDRSPRLATIIGAERTCRRDRNEDPLRIRAVENDRMQAHPAGPRLPVRPGAVTAESRKLVPGQPGIGGTKHCRVLGAGIDRVGIGQRRLEMPDPLEFPRMRRAVIPLVCARHALVHELVAGGFPAPTAVARALDLLSEPAARLRHVQPIRVHRRALHVVDLPATEVRAAHIPALALPIGSRMNAPLRAYLRALVPG